MWYSGGRFPTGSLCAPVLWEAGRSLIFPGTLGKSRGGTNWSDRDLSFVAWERRDLWALGVPSCRCRQTPLQELLELGVHPRGSEKSVRLPPWAAHPSPALQSSSLWGGYKLQFKSWSYHWLKMFYLNLSYIAVFIIPWAIMDTNRSFIRCL